MPVNLLPFGPTLEVETDDGGLPIKATVYQEYSLVILPPRLGAGYKLYRRGDTIQQGADVLRKWVSRSVVRFDED